MLDDVAGTGVGAVVALSARVANAAPMGAAVGVALAYVVTRLARRLETPTGES